MFVENNRMHHINKSFQISLCSICTGVWDTFCFLFLIPFRLHLYVSSNIPPSETNGIAKYPGSLEFISLYLVHVCSSTKSPANPLRLLFSNRHVSSRFFFFYSISIIFFRWFIYFAVKWREVKSAGWLDDIKS